jgi:tRNA modification GTPase
MVNGVKVTLTDSAGVRETADVVEKIGVNKTREAISRADLVLAVFDCSNARLEALIGELPGELEKVVFIGNKNDLVGEFEKKSILSELQKALVAMNKVQNNLDLTSFLRERCILVSSLSGGVQEEILGLIGRFLDTGSFGDDAVLSQARHYENLQRAAECFGRAADLGEEGASPEFLALEVKEGLVRIQETLGERFDDQVLDRVFREFCIGK